jgi:hypothetical protein
VNLEGSWCCWQAAHSTAAAQTPHKPRDSLRRLRRLTRAFPSCLAAAPAPALGPATAACRGCTSSRDWMVAPSSIMHCLMLSTVTCRGWKQSLVSILFSLASRCRPGLQECDARLLGQRWHRGGGGRGRGRRRGAPLQRTSSVPLLCGGNQGRWYSGRHQAAVALVPPARTCRLPGTTLSPLSLARWCSSAPATGHSRRTYQSQSCVMVAQGRQLLLCTARSWLPQEQGVARCWCASWPAHATGGATSSMWTHAVHICRHANGGATTSAHRQRRMPSSGICAGCCWWRPEPCDLQDMVGAA